MPSESNYCQSYDSNETAPDLCVEQDGLWSCRCADGFEASSAAESCEDAKFEICARPCADEFGDCELSEDGTGYACSCADGRAVARIGGLCHSALDDCSHVDCEVTDLGHCDERYSRNVGVTDGGYDCYCIDNDDLGEGWVTYDEVATGQCQAAVAHFCAGE